jgi:hypothetical protein
MAGVQRNLVHRLGQAGVRVLEINLYDLCLDLLDRRACSTAFWKTRMSGRATN